MKSFFKSVYLVHRTVTHTLILLGVVESTSLVFLARMCDPPSRNRIIKYLPGRDNIKDSRVFVEYVLDISRLVPVEHKDYQVQCYSENDSAVSERDLYI
jgi:hypothetical protein